MRKMIGILLSLALVTQARAAISNPSSFQDYTALGGVDFDFTFPVIEAGDVEVWVNGVEQSPTTYTLALTAKPVGATLYPGGKVTFNVAPANGAKVRIQRTIPLTQGLVLQPYSAFPARTIEKTFDRVVMQGQQLDRDRAALAATHAADKSAASATRLGDLSTQAARDTGQDTALSQARVDFTLGAGGFGDGTNITAFSTPTPRSLSKRFGDVVNVLDFGAVPDDGLDDTAAIQAAINVAAAAGDHVTWTAAGRTVLIPAGHYKISATLTVSTGEADGISGVTIRGEGILSTVLEAAPGFAGTTLVKFLSPTYSGLEDIHLQGYNNVSYCAWFEHGSHLDIRRAFAERCDGAGFYFDDVFMMNIEGCRAKLNGTGFDFIGPITSMHVSNTYALNNTGWGFAIRDVLYSTFTSCGSDTNLGGYYVSGAEGLVFNGVGAEVNGRSAWHFEPSIATDGEHNAKGVNATLNECFAVGNNTEAAGYPNSIYSSQPDTTRVNVVVNGFREYPKPGGGNYERSVLSNAIGLNHNVEIRDSIFQSRLEGAGIKVKPATAARKASVSVTGAGTKIATLVNSFGHSVHYAGLVYVEAGSAATDDILVSNEAAYLLLVTKGEGASTNVTVVSSNGLTAGAGATHPSFTWALDGASNELRASPVAATSGTFHFYVTTLGGVLVQ